MLDVQALRQAREQEKSYRICTRCIMDTTARDITFDEDGVCNYCKYYEFLADNFLFTGEDGERRIRGIAARIKEDGRNREYDCVMGLSGGVDSTFAAWHTARLGLRPIIIHLDNGWNTQISINNIENIARNLGLQLFTYVIDWEEFKELQVSFLKASVVDIEMLTDHAIIAVLYRTAIRNKVNYIISGSNIVTEGIMANGWVHSKSDLVNIKDIQKKYGSKKIRSFPTLGLYHKLYYQHVKKIQTVKPLNHVPYVKSEAKETIMKELGWQDYGGKHFESIFTRFYQAYILPVKFNVDKRKAHLSSLIMSGQIDREAALKEMEKPIYESREALESDIEYVLKKLGLSRLEFEDIMKEKPRSHYDFRTDKTTIDKIKQVYRIIRRK